MILLSGRGIVHMPGNDIHLQHNNRSLELVYDPVQCVWVEGHPSNATVGRATAAAAFVDIINTPYTPHSH